MASVDTAFKLPLSLDYSGVLSAWEQIGGNVFDDNTEFSFQDPSAIELDLSDWEAQLKPSCKLEGASGDTLFSAPCNFFFPSELGIAPATNGAAGAAGAKDSQVVPQLPSGCLPSDSESAAAASDEAAAGATDLPMTVPLIKCESIFDDLDLDIPCCSPSLSCNSDAVVPDLGAGDNLSSSHNSNVSSTATSGCTYGVVPQTPAGFVPTEALPQPVVAALPPQPAPVPLPRQPGLKPAAAPAQESIPAPAPTAAAGSSNGAATEVVTFVRTRAECLERYRQKKARRLYTKKIRYQLRKINADKRPRIKGRFVKKEELADYLAANKADVEAAITSGLGAAASDNEDEDAGMEYSDDE